MRERERINRILDLVKQIWEKQQDTRFMQLVDNLKSEYLNAKDGERLDKMVKYYRFDGIIDLFYLEDDKFEQFLIHKLNNKT